MPDRTPDITRLSDPIRAAEKVARRKQRHQRLDIFFP
jgi:hypothetical protein